MQRDRRFGHRTNCSALRTTGSRHCRPFASGGPIRVTRRGCDPRTPGRARPRRRSRPSGRHTSRSTGAPRRGGPPARASGRARDAPARRGDPARAPGGVACRVLEIALGGRQPRQRVRDRDVGNPRLFPERRRPLRVEILLEEVAGVGGPAASRRCRALGLALPQKPETRLGVGQEVLDVDRQRPAPQPDPGRTAETKWSDSNCFSGSSTERRMLKATERRFPSGSGPPRARAPRSVGRAAPSGPVSRRGS